MKTLELKIHSMFPKNWSEVPEHVKPIMIEQNFYLGRNGIMPHIKNGRYIEVYSPIYVGDKPVRLGKYPQMTQKQVQEIINAQNDAWDSGNGEWPSMDHRERCLIVRNCISEMQKTRPIVTNLLMWETGKTLKLAEAEFDRTIEYLFKTCDEFDIMIKKWDTPLTKGNLTFQLGYNGAGRVLSMGPSNYPMNETFQLIFPLILTGNVVCIKHAKSGILMLAPIIEVLAKTLPHGVITTLYGDGKKVITPRVVDPSLEFFAFIGGADSADRISKKIKKPHQVGSFKGLNAKNPLFVLKGANIPFAAKMVLDSAIENNNAERCTATKQVYVAEECFDKFAKEITRLANNIKFGMPWEDVTNRPLLPGSLPWMQQLLDDALAKGATIINDCGGVVSKSYMHPVVLIDVTDDMLVCQHEQFCPIIPIYKMDDKEGLDKALDWIKKSDFGQQLSIIATKAKDEKTVDYIIQQTKNQVCQVNINQTGKRYDDMPFSGRKGSGQDSISLLEAIMIATFPHVVVIDKSY